MRTYVLLSDRSGRYSIFERTLPAPETSNTQRQSGKVETATGTYPLSYSFFALVGCISWIVVLTVCQFIIHQLPFRLYAQKPTFDDRRG
jgi:hypothetical protein